MIFKQKTDKQRNMEKTQQNFKQYQKSSTIIHAALLIGQVFFAAFVIFLNQTEGPLVENEFLGNIFMIMIPLFFLGSFGIGKVVAGKKLKLAKEKAELKAKMADYRSINIIRYALLEGTAFFAIITFMLMGEMLLLAFAGMIMILFAINYPSKEKLVGELELNREEQAILEDPDAIVAEISMR